MNKDRPSAERDAQEFRTHLQDILESVTTSEHAIEHVVDFIESAMLTFRGKKKLPEAFDLAKLIRHTILLQRVEPRFSQVDIHFETRGLDFTLHALKGYLSSNLVALLKYAADAILEKNADGRGNIWITLNETHSDRALTLIIKDDGIGMSKETTARMFELDCATKSHGTGKGMPELHAFLKEQGGTISVQSEPGVGTTLTLVLPKLQKAVVTAE